jgi:hypothetical protein
MKRGHIRQRGAHSFELKYETGSPDGRGRRQVRYETIRVDTRKEAEKHLTARLAQIDAGVDQKPTRLTLTKYLREWLVQAKHLGVKTSERYGQLIEQQITRISARPCCISSARRSSPNGMRHCWKRAGQGAGR